VFASAVGGYDRFVPDHHDHDAGPDIDAGKPALVATTEFTAPLQKAAVDVFGWEELHPRQLEAMQALMEGRDVLAVLPTGSGKSAVYQVPTLLLDGPTVIVSPLLALQRDQAHGLREAGAPAAVVVNSQQRAAELRDAWAQLESGEARFVFLSPEQLAKGAVVDRLAALGVTLVVVDEAHCVSSWGHDFRPDYLRLAPAIERLGRPSVVALTATAAPPVQDDIVERLGIDGAARVVASFDRPEIRLEVSLAVTEDDKRAGVLEFVTDAVGRGERGLVYTASRAATEECAAALVERGVIALAYHAGMKREERSRVHDAFLDDTVDVVVATSAFGMGIDKPDVRFVVHASLPESLDSYYQQVGRAGRDGDPATARMFYRPEDEHIQNFLTTSKPPKAALKDVATLLHVADGPLSPAEILRRAKAGRAQAQRALDLLEQAGAALPAGTGSRRGLEWSDRSVAVKAAVAVAVGLAEAHQRLTRSRVEMMRGYADTTGCRRQVLLGYFGEQLAEPCGHCDTCEKGTAAQEQPDETGPLTTGAEVEHDEWGRGVVMQVEADRLTVLFDTVGYKTVSRAILRPGGLLELDAS
jgi:ATP-dependent DNA helicase RecQ